MRQQRQAVAQVMRIGSMMTAGSAARSPQQRHGLQAAAAGPEGAAGESQMEQGEGLGDAEMAEGLGEAPASPSRDVHLGSTGGNSDSEGSVSQPAPFSGQPSHGASPSQQERAAMLQPAGPRRQAQQAAPRRPLQLAGLQPGDEAIEVGGRWAQKAVRGDFDGLRRREHLKAPIHLATPVAASLPPAASAAPAGPAARGWAGQGAGAPAAAAAAEAGTAAVVGSAAWPYARPPAAQLAWQEERQQWQPPPQWQRQQRLGAMAEEPGRPLEDEEVEQFSEEAGAAGYISEYGMEEGAGWPVPAQLVHAPPHRRAPAPHAAAGGRKRHRQGQQQGHHAGGRLAAAAAPPQAAKRPRVRQGGGGQPDWPREVERRGHADPTQEPWRNHEAEEFEGDDSGYSRWAGRDGDREG